MNRRFVILILSLLTCLRAFGQAASAGFEGANRLYDQGKYAEASAEYQKLIQSGRGTSAVYFNLGNALLKSGQLGRAVATYRTLETATPRDPDLMANLKFALGQVKGPTLKPGRFQQWLRKVTLNEWTLAAAACFWGTLLLIALGQLRTGLRRALRPYILLLGAGTVLLGVCLVIAVKEASVPRAIVIAEEAAVRQGPLDETAALFTVHHGAELRVLDRQQEWLQISVDARRVGWIRKSVVLAAQR